MTRTRTGRTAPDAAEALPARAWALMAVLCVAQVLEVLGVTVVIVALPAIGADLGLDDARLQLVISLYAVVYGGLLLTAGRVADALDRRAVFATGLAVTLVGAVLCATAGTSAALLTGRAGAGPCRRRWWWCWGACSWSRSCWPSGAVAPRSSPGRS